MTYQSPYQPPQGGYPNFDYYSQQRPDLLAPARRAAMMLYVIGAICILSSVCCIGTGTMLPQIMQNPEFAQEMRNVPGVTPEMLRTVMFTSGVMALVLGIVLIMLGVFVGKGSKVAVILALVISILAGLWMLFSLVSSLAMGAAPTQARLVGICTLAVPLAMIVLLIVWLIGALKSAEEATAARYAMQYWQQYGQQAYGGYPPGMPQEPPAQPPGQPPHEAGGPRADEPPPPPFPPTRQ